MEGIIIKLKNKNKKKKYIKVSTPESRKTKDYAMIYLYDDRLCISQCKGIGIEALRKIGYECFYWLMHDDYSISIAKGFYEDYIYDSFESWKKSITHRMNKYKWFDSWETCEIVINSFNTYKKYL